ncbi:MAG TPA: hypothetical protein PLQ59_08425 [Fervidobacterium sp.]|nr:hypothetical protein [Fervidobacterium sp.]
MTVIDFNSENGRKILTLNEFSDLFNDGETIKGALYQFDKDLSKELNGQKLPIEEFCYRVYEEIEKKGNTAFEVFIITMAVLYRYMER